MILLSYKYIHNTVAVSVCLKIMVVHFKNMFCNLFISFQKKMALKPVFQWAIGISCGVLGLIIYLISKYVGYPEEFEQNIGTYNVFIHFFNSSENSQYISNVTDAISSAKSEIRILSRYFVPSNESHPIINSLLSALNRSITIKLLTYESTDTSLEFFNKVQYRVLCRNSSIANFIVSDYIIVDDSEYLHLSNFFEESNYSSTNLIGIRIKDKTVVEDAKRIFDMNWAFLTPEEAKKIPPQSLYWPFNFMPLTEEGKTVSLKDNSQILLTAPSAKYKVPNRVLIKPKIESWLSNIHDSNILISSSYFEMPSNPFFENALVSAMWNNSKVNLLLSNNKDNLTNLMSAGLLAPFANISIRIGPENSNYPNYIIINDTLFFVSDSITGRLFRDSFGIGLLAKGEDIVSSVTRLFWHEWNSSSVTAFHLHNLTVYDDDEI